MSAFELGLVSCTATFVVAFWLGFFTYKLRKWPWLRPWYWRQRIRIRWQLWRAKYRAWRSGLVALPSGVLTISSIVLNNEEQLVDDVPAEFFSCVAYNSHMLLHDAFPGCELSVVFCNRSNYTFQVDAAFRLSDPFNEGRMYMLRLGSYVMKPHTQQKASAQLPKAIGGYCRLFVGLPDYVKRPELVT